MSKVFLLFTTVRQYDEYSEEPHEYTYIAGICASRKGVDALFKELSQKNFIVDAYVDEGEVLP